MHTRPATLADAAELARLRWEFTAEETPVEGARFADFTQRFESFLCGALGDGQWLIWVAERDGRLVGHIYLQLIEKVPRPGQTDGRYGYVTNVYVEPTSRDEGIGSQLLRGVIERAREQRLEFLIVWPSERSVPYYARVGFAPSGEAMELPLDPG